VVHPLAKGEIESIGRRDMVQWPHMEGFQDKQRYPVRGLAGVVLQDGSYRASPLQGEGCGHFLFGRETEFFKPLPNFSVAGAALRFEGGEHFVVG